MKTISWRGAALGLLSGLFVLGLVLVFLQGSAIQGKGNASPGGWSVIRPPSDVDALVVGPQEIWAGGKDGVFRLDLETLQVSGPVNCGHPVEYVRALVLDADGTLWIGHDRGLSRRDSAGCVLLTEQDGLPDPRVNALLRDRAGRLWVGTWGGAAVLSDGVWRTLTSRDGLLVDMVSVIMEDAQGGMWFGSAVAPQGGLSILQDGGWQHLSTDEGLPHNNINALVQDSQGAVWIGTGLMDRGGTARLIQQDGAWSVKEVFDSQDGLAGNKGRSLMIDRGGRTWVGSEYDGLSRRDQSGWKVLTVQDGLSHNEIKVMLQDDAGNLWIGTRDGITRIDSRDLP